MKPSKDPQKKHQIILYDGGLLFLLIISAFALMADSNMSFDLGVINRVLGIENEPKATQQENILPSTAPIPSPTTILDDIVGGLNALEDLTNLEQLPIALPEAEKDPALEDDNADDVVDPDLPFVDQFLEEVVEEIKKQPSIGGEEPPKNEENPIEFLEKFEEGEPNKRQEAYDTIIDLLQNGNMEEE